MAEEEKEEPTGRAAATIRLGAMTRPVWLLSDGRVLASAARTTTPEAEQSSNRAAVGCSLGTRGYGNAAVLCPFVRPPRAMPGTG